MPGWMELRDKAGAKFKEAQTLIEGKSAAELSSLPDDVQEKYLALIAEAKALDAAWSNDPGAKEFRERIKAGPIPWGNSGDAKERDPNRAVILAPNESFAEATGGGTEYKGVSFGDFARSLVQGPKTKAERKVLDEAVGANGSYLVPTPLSGTLIDRLRSASTVVRAGAKTVPMKSKTLAIARLLTDPTAQWKAENALATESTPQFERVELTAHTLMIYVRSSRELLQDAPNIESALDDAFRKALAGGLDLAALYGTGLNDQPTGLANQANINVVSMGVNGAAITSYDPLVDARSAILGANATEPTSVIMAPRTGGVLGKLKDTTNQPLRRPDALSNIKNWYETTRVPINETQGTAVNASSIFEGEFAEMILGIRNEVTIEVVRDQHAQEFQWAFLAWLRADVALLHPQSFARIVGVIP